MNKGLIGMCFGIIVVAGLALNANAQMCECMGGHDGGMMGGMGHGGMGMMQGMCGMHGDGPMMMGGEEHPMLKHLMALGLDDKQKAAIRALHSRTMKEMARKRADKEIAGIELRDLLEKDPVDVKAVEAAVKKKESIKAELFMMHVKAHEEMKSLLTPEQKKKLKELMDGGRGPGCSMMGGMHEEMEHKDMPMHEHAH